METNDNENDMKQRASGDIFLLAGIVLVCAIFIFALIEINIL
jgi:hypothetical protein